MFTRSHQVFYRRAWIETPRLRLSPWTKADTGLLVRLSADPAVVRYVGDGATWSRSRASEISRAMAAHWRRHGFGWRVARERDGGEAIGFVALSLSGEGTAGVAADEFEIGWWLARRAWGQGFATEGARAVLAEAFERLRAPSVIARIQPANVASLAVARRIGLTFDFETTGRVGERCSVYRGQRHDLA